MSSPSFPPDDGFDVEVEYESVMHIVPVDDVKEHLLARDGRCWCNPRVEWNGLVYVHNSADGREDYEEGRRKPN